MKRTIHAYVSLCSISFVPVSRQCSLGFHSCKISSISADSALGSSVSVLACTRLSSSLSVTFWLRCCFVRQLAFDLVFAPCGLSAFGSGRFGGDFLTQRFGSCIPFSGVFWVSCSISFMPKLAFLLQVVSNGDPKSASCVRWGVKELQPSDSIMHDTVIGILNAVCVPNACMPCFSF